MRFLSCLMFLHPSRKLHFIWNVWGNTSSIHNLICNGNIRPRARDCPRASGGIGSEREGCCAEGAGAGGAGALKNLKNTSSFYDWIMYRVSVYSTRMGSRLSQWHCFISATLALLHLGNSHIDMALDPDETVAHGLRYSATINTIEEKLCVHMEHVLENIWL